MFNVQKKSHGIYEDPIYIHDSSAIGGFISLGCYSVIDKHCWVENAVIGRFTTIGKRVRIGITKIFDEAFSNHPFTLGEGKKFFPNDEYYQTISTSRFFFEKRSTVFIGHDVKIGDECIIYSGVKIGDGVIIYPNSIVDKDLESYGIYAGNPARKIDERLKDFNSLRISNFDWTDLNLSELVSQKKGRINYLNLNKIEASYELYSLKKRDIKEVRFNTQGKLSVTTEIAVLGPSHIPRWRNKISLGELNNSPYLLYGESGMSLYSKSFSRFLDWWILNKKRKAVILVPDFRIGNSIIGSSKFDPLFIDNAHIDNKSDQFLYREAILKLDTYKAKYGKNIKFIFWCLYGRELINIDNQKYINEHYEYNHPHWNYSEFVSRFKEVTIDISSELEVFIEKYIEPDGTIHPTNEGYDYLDRTIRNAF